MIQIFSSKFFRKTQLSWILNSLQIPEHSLINIFRLYYCKKVHFILLRNLEKFFDLEEEISTPFPLNSIYSYVRVPTTSKFLWKM